MTSIDVRAGDQMLIAGINGSGKSVLASAIARRFSRVLVYDPKADPSAEIPGAAVVATAADAIRALPGRVIYRPTGDEGDQVETRFDQICAKVLADGRDGRGATAVVVHETYFLASANRIGPRFRELIVGGRSLGITRVLVTQRPVGIPVICRSESKHFACFALTTRDDRAEMAGYMGDAITQASLPLDFSFWYRGPDLRLIRAAPVPLR